MLLVQAGQPANMADIPSESNTVLRHFHQLSKISNNKQDSSTSPSFHHQVKGSETILECLLHKVCHYKDDSELFTVTTSFF